METKRKDDTPETEYMGDYNKGSEYVVMICTKRRLDQMIKKERFRWSNPFTILRFDRTHVVYETVIGYDVCRKPPKRHNRYHIYVSLQREYQGDKVITAKKLYPLLL